MEPAHFNLWRANYDRMSYQDQMAFYDLVEAEHSNQNSFNPEAWEAFFEWLPLEKIIVFELGGWHGEMAAHLLPAFPKITRWVNWEISRAAVNGTVCDDSRYEAEVPIAFAWLLPLPAHNVFVASHTLEHIRLYQAYQLFKELPEGVYIGLEVPVSDDIPNWDGYHGSHIIEGGWLDIAAIVNKREVEELRREHFRAYET